MSTNAKLLPCPFCGSEAVPEFRWHGVPHTRCIYCTDVVAVERWNTRALTPQPDAGPDGWVAVGPETMPEIPAGKTSVRCIVGWENTSFVNLASFVREGFLSEFGQFFVTQPTHYIYEPLPPAPGQTPAQGSEVRG